MTPSRRTRWRRLRMGVATLLWPNRPQGFFIPYRFASLVRDRQSTLHYSVCEDLFAKYLPDFSAVLAQIEPYEGALNAIGGEPAPAPRWDQDWFSGLDAAIAYSFVRHRPPSRLIEIGAGHSTRFFAKARADSEKQFRIMTIDPEPRSSIVGLELDHVQQDVTRAPQEIWEDIASGDILSIDSSHILQPGTDVDFLMNQILPRLPTGARVHVHDIFLPDTYPPGWQWRGYNEQIGWAALLATGTYRPLFASHYMKTRHKDLLMASPAAPFADRGGAPAASLWLEKVR